MKISKIACPMDKFHNIKVVYRDHLEGGGRTFGQQFIPVVKEKIGRVDHIFEFCAGSGFIGFSLLANNLCEKLTLADINPEAIEVCKETIKNNNLESKVSTYVSDCLDSMPETEKWDLVVGNPPHWFCAEEERWRRDIRKFDPNFKIHQRFYQDIRKFLKPSGSVLLQENREATSEATFKEMIEKNGLKIIDVFSLASSHGRKEKKATRAGRYPPDCFYFIWSKLKNA